MTTQFLLIKELPQKWDPKRLWGGKRGEELGWAGWAPQNWGQSVTGPLGACPPHCAVSLQCLWHQPCLGSGQVPYPQGHLPGPRAGHRIVPIDDPLTVMHRGADDWQPTACRRAGGTRGGPRQLMAHARGLSVPARVALCHHPQGATVLMYPEDLPTPAGSTYLRWCWQG